MKTLAHDINVFNSKEQRVSLKALGMFYRPSLKCWVKRIYIKGHDEKELLNNIKGFVDNIKKEFASCPVTVTPYTEADALKRAQYKADAGPAQAPRSSPANTSNLVRGTSSDELALIVAQVIKALNGRAA